MIDTTQPPGASASPTEPPSSRTVSAADRIVRDVIRGLYENRFVPGQRLVEPDLMRRYQAGRSTVREAIKRLAADGIVTVHAHRGAQIRQLSRADAGNVFLVLELMIGLAARLCARNISLPGRKDDFQRAYDHLLSFEHAGDSYELVYARNRFYRTLTRISANAELERILPTVQVHIVRARLRQPQAQRFADYRSMADAILKGDAEAAEAAARDHIRNMGQALAGAPDDLFAPDDPHIDI